jgi:anti-sigma-K factor RskA
MAHEQYKEMIAAQALSALDEGEARALDVHLQTCAECRAEMDEWRETAAWLALDAKPLEPSPRLRTEILLQIKTDAASPKHGDAKIIAMPSRRARGWTSAQKWGALAAAFVIAALLISLLALWRQNISARNELAQLSKQIEETRQELDREREALSIMTSPGARLAELSGTGVAPAAHGTIAYDQTGRAILMTKDLPPPPPGKAYQLWFIAGGPPIPGKVFKTNPAGAGTLNDHIPNQALNAAMFAITLEPENGVPKPTGEIYLKSGS